MKRSKIVFYKDRKGEHRWKFVARNGRVLADSGEGYKTFRGAQNGFMAMSLPLFKAEVDIYGWSVRS